MRPSHLCYPSGLWFWDAFLLIIHAHSGSGGSIDDKEASSKVEGGVSCTLEVQGRTNQVISSCLRNE